MCGECAQMRPLGGNTLSFAAISTAAMPLSKDFVGMRHHLDKEKKEALSQLSLLIHFPHMVLHEEVLILLPHISHYFFVRNR